MQLPSAVRRRRTLAALLCAAAIPLTAGCSGGSTGDDDGPPSPGSSSSAAAVEPDYAMGVVTGHLDRKHQQQLLAKVRPVVDGWIEAAYLGDYPRSDFSAPGFTGRAARRAADDPDVASNAGLGKRLTAVRATAEHVRLDALASRNRPAGVTVRFRLDLDLEGDDIDQSDRVVGRLFLSHADHDWKIFGYSIRRRTL